MWPVGRIVYLGFFNVKKGISFYIYIYISHNLAPPPPPHPPDSPLYTVVYLRSTFHHRTLLLLPLFSTFFYLKNERKEMFLFNDALNTFYLWLYGVKDYSDSERGNKLPPFHGLFFLISSKGSFILTSKDKIIHTTAYATPVVEQWLE